MMEEFVQRKGYVSTIDILKANDEELAIISREMGLALSKEEMKKIKEYFKHKGRLPTDLELQALGQAWSEHCCYKSSKPILKENIYGIEEEKIIAREDAGVMEFDDEHYYVAALESHNHPSAIEPYGGAATGIGGIVRDVLCMGAQPIALIDPLYFGRLDFDYKKLPKGVKHPRYLFKRVVEGIRDYGNRIGIPTVAGQVYFHDGYVGNCIVNVGCIGIVKKKNLIHSRVKKPGDVYIYAGGKTGRDGIHGVTFASEELREESEEESLSAVQLGDPITKEPLIHACLECVEKGLVEGMKDMGGGGLSCVCGELAYDAGYGAEIYLDKVPLREENMSPWEIWVSESQERMMLAVKKKNVDAVLSIFKQWDVDAVPVGKVIEEPVIRILFKGQIVGEMDLRFQVGAVIHKREKVKPVCMEKEEDFPPLPVEESFLRILSSLNVSSREWVIRQYDFEVRGSTVGKPLCGAIERQTHADAAVIKPLENSFKGIALTADCNPFFTSINPYWGACSAVDEICRNLVAVGAYPDSIADCLNFGNPEKPERMGELDEATRGLAYMARELHLPFISGNVSLYNENPTGPIPPTPTLLGIGIVEDVRKCISSYFKKEGNPIFLIGKTKKEMGGSEYYQLMEKKGGIVPRVDIPLLKKCMDVIHNSIQKGFISSCHDISNGGLAVCLAEMVIGGKGAEVCLYGMGDMRIDFKLFSESNTRWIVEVEKEKEDEFKKFCEGIPILKIGEVKGDRLTIYDGDEMKKYIDVSRDKLFDTWNKTLWNYMG